MSVNINDITPEDVEEWIKDRRKGLGLSSMFFNLYATEGPTWGGIKDGEHSGLGSYEELVKFSHEKTSN